MKMNKIFLILLVAFYLPVNAQEKVDLVPVKKGSSRVKLSFENELLNGSALKPDGDSINNRPDFNLKKLIRVRENFVDEVEGGLNDFKGN